MKLPFKSMRRASAALLAAISGAAIVTPLIATAASATTYTGGWVELCKSWNNTEAALSSMNPNANFTFNITGTGTSSVTVPAGTSPNFTCAKKVWVASSTGMVTVSEQTGSWYETSSISAQGSEANDLSNIVTGPAGSVDVTLGGSNHTTTIYWINDPVWGWTEVCKTAPPNSLLSGTFTYSLSGEDGYTGSASTSVGPPPLGYCSAPIEVPAGTLTVVENPQSGTDTLNVPQPITANLNLNGSSELLTENQVTGTATVTVVASTNTQTQTDVYYTDDVVTLKVCKYFVTSGDSGWVVDNSGSPVNSYPFTESVVSGAAGPNTAPSGTFNVTVGYCSATTPYRAGTVVSVTEGIVPGTKLVNVAATGGYDNLTTNLVTRTSMLTLGTSVTNGGTTPLNNDVQLKFYDAAADPGNMKICKYAGSPAPKGSSFDFTVTNASGATMGTATVPVGECRAVVDSSGNAVEFPFNSTVTVTEAASAGNSTSSITTGQGPTDVTEIVNGVATDTGVPVIVPGSINLGSGADTASSVQVMIGEGNTTEVDFTDIDPSSSSNTSSSNSSSSNSSSSNSSSSNSSSSNSSSSSSPSNYVAPSTSSPSTSTPTVSVNVSSTPSTSSSLTSRQLAALKSDKAALSRDLAKMQKVIANLKMRLQQASHTRGSMHQKIEEIIRQLVKERAILAGQIRSLNAAIHVLEALA